MWPTRGALAAKLSNQLLEFSRKRPLAGATTQVTRGALAWQFVASIRRFEYLAVRRTRNISQHRIDPNHQMFDPELAAILHARDGDLDEAFWLAFLVTHFGKHRLHGWRLLQDVYSGLGKQTWTWKKVAADPAALRAWLVTNRSHIRGGFGNHRKYETLGDVKAGTAAIIADYVEWVGPTHSHAKLVRDLVREAGNDPHKIFDEFYQSMRVRRFGRLGKFDFLTLVGLLGLAPVEPGQAYIREASGPLTGARLLFLGDPDDRRSDRELDAWVIELGASLGLGPHVLEDAICNWQKSPNKFVHFRG